MNTNSQEFAFKRRSKLLIYFLFAFVGIPMLYAAYLNFQVGERLMGALTLGLFGLWALVIFVIAIYKLVITDSAIQQVRLFSSKALNFSEIKSIHFGSTFSSFYVQNATHKIHISKDLKDYEKVIRQIINRVVSAQNFENVKISGKTELVEKYTDEIGL